MKTPDAPQIAPDPMFQTLANQAQGNLTDATKAITASDYGSLLSRYGALVNLAGTKGTAPILGNPVSGGIAKSMFSSFGSWPGVNRSAGAGHSGA